MQNKKGFTLVELLVVIAILAVLAIIGYATYAGIQARARDARRRADVDAISKAWETHYSTGSPRYPSLQGSWFSNNTVPVDPMNSGIYVYSGTNTNTDTYEVCANLENGTQYCFHNQQ